MSKSEHTTAAGQQYTAAHQVHYSTKDLSQALGLYCALIDAHPETEEAEYSRVQIQNIVTAVVPKQTLFDAQVELALVHVHESPQNAARPPTAPSAAALPSQRL